MNDVLAAPDYIAGNVTDIRISKDVSRWLAEFYGPIAAYHEAVGLPVITATQSVPSKKKRPIPPIGASRILDL